MQHSSKALSSHLQGSPLQVGNCHGEALRQPQGTALRICKVSHSREGIYLCLQSSPVLNRLYCHQLMLKPSILQHIYDRCQKQHRTSPAGH